MCSAWPTTPLPTFSVPHKPYAHSVDSHNILTPFHSVTLLPTSSFLNLQTSTPPPTAYVIGCYYAD